MGPKKTPKPTNESDDESEDLNTCKVCKKSFQSSVMRHLGRPNNSCVKQLTQEEFLSLKKKCFKRSQKKRSSKYDSKNANLLLEKRALYYQVNREN